LDGTQKVKAALEARNPGYTVSQMSDLTDLSEFQCDELMVTIVNAGPPITDPAQLYEANKE